MTSCDFPFTACGKARAPKVYVEALHKLLIDNSYSGDYENPYAKATFKLDNQSINAFCPCLYFIEDDVEDSMEDFKLKMSRDYSAPFETQPRALSQIKETQANTHCATRSSTKKGLCSVLATCRDKSRSYA